MAMLISYFSAILYVPFSKIIIPISINGFINFSNCRWIDKCSLWDLHRYRLEKILLCLSITYIVSKGFLK